MADSATKEAKAMQIANGMRLGKGASAKKAAKDAALAALAGIKGRGKNLTNKAMHRQAIRRLPMTAIGATAGGAFGYDAFRFSSRFLGKSATSRGVGMMAAGAAMAYGGHSSGTQLLADGGSGMIGAGACLARIGFLAETHPVRVAMEKDAELYLAAQKADSNKATT